MSLLSRLAVQAAKGFGALSSGGVKVDYLVVAGGGGSGADVGGGGGAGGLLASVATLSILNTYAITVGAGGNGGVYSGAVAATGGTNSVLSGTGLTTITATGGGIGGIVNTSGGNGGSGGGGGGGGGSTTSGGTGTSGQGNNGGSGAGGSNFGGGGGGGASAVGANRTTTTGGNGGAGTASSISGSSVTYAGGGGGGAVGSVGATAGTGGAGGGGNGAATGTGTAGTVNLGGGAGGGGNSGNGGAGGSGIVIISYTSATPKFVGGTMTTSGGKQIHTFTSSGSLSPITPITASYLVVAGGGSGGVNTGGGGGAGGLLSGSATLYSGATYVVTVGAGGAAPSTSGNPAGNNGSNSVLLGTGLTTITSTGGGGGGGGGTNRSGFTGGSGGGGSGINAGSAGNTPSTSPSQGNNGGTSSDSDSAGGGGGAGAVGGNGNSTKGGDGGAGTASSISGSSVTYAGGGGGGGSNTRAKGTGGSGGGGGGGGSGAQAGSSGTTNLGGGGGGSSGATVGGAGGSGTVIISYAGSQVFNGGLVTSSGGNTIHTFNATGALTPLTNNLTNSLRFRRSASGYLSRTPASASNRTTWTWSGWVKRGALGLSEPMFSSTAVNNDNGWFTIKFQTTDTIGVEIYSGNVLITTQVFRDPSSWYHVVLAVDTTQATAANRLKLYINGVQVTSFSTASYPAQNFNYSINSAQSHVIGSFQPYASDNFDGYMTDINFIDGQALEPYYFGNNDANGVWKPIKYTGMYGTNGFYLTFADTSALTTSSNAGLGKDTSGNGNYWTTNNISITAGTTYDAMTDVPTNTSATVANYAVMNPLQKSTGVTASNGNLNLSTGGGSVPAKILSTIGMSSGKYYCEMTLLSGSGNYGLATANTSLGGTTYLGDDASSWCYAIDGNKYTSGSGAAYGATYTTNDVIGIAFDADAGTLTFYKNGTSQGTAFTGLTSGPYFFAQGASPSTAAVNFGQRPFSYTPPAGFVALNTYNLPTPTILQGNKYMDATLWTGNGQADNQTVTNAALFKPDLVWAKNRNIASQNNVLVDSVRGVNQVLSSNLTDAQSALSSINPFNSNGFGVGGIVANGYAQNVNGYTYVGWQWQAGQGTTTVNTSGTISSNVSVSTTAGFSIVTYTGTGSNATVGHGLGVAPKWIIVKARSAVNDWPVYHIGQNATPQNGLVYLNGTNAYLAASTIWNNTAPTSTTFAIGTSGATNASGVTFVAYCWAEIAGFSKFGSYTGNGSADGPFVYTGFLPKYILIKRTDTTASWVVMDTSRGLYNASYYYLLPNLADADSGPIAMDFLSNGFKLRLTSAAWNASGGTYIYMAFAEHPFKTSNGR